MAHEKCKYEQKSTEMSGDNLIMHEKYSIVNLSLRTKCV